MARWATATRLSRRPRSARRRNSTMGHLYVDRPHARTTSSVNRPLRTNHARRAVTAALALVVCGGIVVVNVSTGSAAARSSGPTRKMIVILRDQNSALAPRSAARNAAVRTEQAPIVKSLRKSGATDISSLTVMNALVARMSAAEVRLLAADPAVAHVLTNAVVSGPTATSHPVSSERGAKVVHEPTSKVTVNGLCGSAHDPQLNPEALTNIDATPSAVGRQRRLRRDGRTSSPTVSIHPTRTFSATPPTAHRANQSCKQYDFSSDGTNAPTQGERSVRRRELHRGA